MHGIRYGEPESEDAFRNFFHDVRENGSAAADFGELLILKASCLDENTSHQKALTAMRAYAKKHPKSVDSW